LLADHFIFLVADSENLKRRVFAQFFKYRLVSA